MKTLIPWGKKINLNVGFLILKDFFRDQNKFSYGFHFDRLFASYLAINYYN